MGSSMPFLDHQQSREREEEFDNLKHHFGTSSVGHDFVHRLRRFTQMNSKKYSGFWL